LRRPRASKEGSFTVEKYPYDVQESSYSLEEGSFVIEKGSRDVNEGSFTMQEGSCVPYEPYISCNPCYTDESHGFMQHI
jgi:hypothetical protein